MDVQHKSSSIIGVKELRQNLEKYISQINKGRTFTVVKRSKPVFKISPADEWGDDGVWETVVDFTKFNKKGISAKDLLKRLRTLNG